MKIFLLLTFFLTNTDNSPLQDTLYHKRERSYTVNVVKDSLDYLVVAKVKNSESFEVIMRYQLGTYRSIKIFDIKIHKNYYVCIDRQGVTTGFIVCQYKDGRWQPHMGNTIVTDGNWTKPFTISLQGHKKIRIEQGRRVVVYKLDFKNRTARKVRDRQRE